jgi:cytochrome P450
LVARFADISPLATRVSAKLIADPIRYLNGKPFERQLLVYELPHRQLALANDPRVVETVLADRAGTFPKSRVVGSLLRPIIGEGLFGQAGGDKVKAARRLFIQAIARIPDQEVSRIARATSETYIARWLADAGPVTVPCGLSRLAIDIISRAMLGRVFSASESRRFVELFFAYHKRAAPLLLMVAGQTEARAETLVRNMGLEEIGAEMRELIRARFVEPIKARDPDALSAPLASVLEEADGENTVAILDQIAVMLLAGHETTASTLSWLVWELAHQPVEQEAAAFLLRGGDAKGKRAHPWQDVSPPKVLMALVEEALRLYPPIAFFLRETTSDVTFRGKVIPLGSFVVAAPWALHRHRSVWQHPDEFRPRRWLDEKWTPPPASFIPFGFGPRSCPGQRFAYLEMYEILHALLTRCRLLPSGGVRPTPLGSLTSRPDREFALRFERRQS